MIALTPALATVAHNPSLADRLFIAAVVAIIGAVYYCYLFDLFWPPDDGGQK